MKKWIVHFWIAFAAWQVFFAVACASSKPSPQLARARERAAIELVAHGVRRAVEICAHAGDDLNGHGRTDDAKKILKTCADVYDGAKGALLTLGAAYDASTETSSIACALHESLDAMAQMVNAAFSLGGVQSDTDTAIVKDAEAIGASLLMELEPNGVSTCPLPTK